TDDHAAVPRGETPGRLGRGVIRRETRVSECGDVGWLERFVDLDHTACRRLEVLGIPPVAVDARERVGLAMHVVAGAAGPTQPTGDQRGHDHLVSFTDIGHRGAYCRYPAGVLVPDRVRQLQVWVLLGPLAFEDVQVGAAHAGAADLDDHVERSRRRGYRHLRHLEVLVVADNLDGSHGAHDWVSFPTSVSCCCSVSG